MKPIAAKIASMAAGLVIGAPAAVLADWASIDTVHPLRTPYVRSAPDARAARYAPETLPKITGSRGMNPDIGAALLREGAADASLEDRGPWLTATGVSDNTRQLLAFLRDSTAHGLSPEHYGLTELERAVARREHEAALSAFGAAASHPRGSRVIDNAAAEDNTVASRGERLERHLDATFRELATHLGRGIVDARSTQRRLFRDVPDPDIDALMAAIDDGELYVAGAIVDLLPSNPAYGRLVDRLRDLLAERERGTERTHVPDIGSLWVGHHHDDVMYFKRRMIETGDLDPDALLTPMFDAPLVLAIQRFQARHGLPPAAIVDPRTRAAMNTSIDEDIERIALSLERWRWMPRDLGELHVYVNLPDYRLHVLNGEQRIVDMVVVIGATEHETPSFSREMTYLSVNPTWTVPKSIAHRELLPREQRSPGYLRKRNFEFLRYVDGRPVVVPYDSVSHAQLSKRPFPYMLRQRGGPGNALGRMKFMLPNPYSIYLHDTQAKTLFLKNDRAYSHGCIRLANPDHLLNVLLQVDGRSPEDVQSLLREKKTRNVRLETPIPTHLAYFTTWIDADGTEQVRPDVYRYDAALRIALQAAGTLLSEPRGSGIERRVSLD